MVCFSEEDLNLSFTGDSSELFTENKLNVAALSIWKDCLQNKSNCISFNR